eukprot:CAMPEP_0118944148 /NCGR_PEP_ID=MMETSP1169-20130426/39733_1 /TAXON_ID=36882 /ORGANISM="Pyramimonas obovata, Strain CCMP722" /LENGTH=48 /DNA_ID= /DNA_START= /DNA_END= /DNA_ORIENTATION=
MSRRLFTANNSVARNPTCRLATTTGALKKSPPAWMSRTPPVAATPKNA